MSDDTAKQESRLCDVLASYYIAQEAGQGMHREALIQQNADLAADLIAHFEEADLLRRVTGPLRQIVAPEPVGPAGGGEGETVEDGTRPDDAKSVGTETEQLPGPERPSTLPVGCHVFGDYELIEELACGGMGIVYKARQLSLNRVVALKAIKAGTFATAIEIRRFRSEAEAVAALDHPNIVPIYEVGEERGIHFFSMKLTEKGTLAARIEQFQADPTASATVMAKVARAVHHAHRRGILHRDLKPSNVLLGEDDEPLVADFGLAKRVGSETDMTLTGAVLGSPPYMAPEQAAHRHDDITTATDVYGLGAILYVLLTGRPPFRANSAWETLQQVKEEKPKAPRDWDRRIHPDLQTICLKCLEKNPNDRYGSAQEVAEDLERWLRGEAILARPSGLFHRVSLWCRQPARQREAGIYAMVLSTVLGVAATVAIAAFSMGLLSESFHPSLAIKVISRWIFAGYLPMFGVGWMTLARKRWAVRVGLLHSATVMGVMIAYTAGWSSFGSKGVISDDTVGARFWNHALLFGMLSFYFFFYVVANLSRSGHVRSRELSR